METLLLFHCCLRNVWFKSYYVVWKPRSSTKKSTKRSSLNRTMQYGNLFERIRYYCYCGWFKSYYVVWKLGHYYGQKNHCDTFKSYYVVWKRLTHLINIGIISSLNRTMQYGNYLFQNTRFRLLCRLNRTMQYGNWWE